MDCLHLPWHLFDVALVPTNLPNQPPFIHPPTHDSYLYTYTHSLNAVPIPLVRHVLELRSRALLALGTLLEQMPAPLLTGACLRVCVSSIERASYVPISLLTGAVVRH